MWNVSSKDIHLIKRVSKTLVLLLMGLMFGCEGPYMAGTSHKLKSIESQPEVDSSLLNSKNQKEAILNHGVLNLVIRPQASPINSSSSNISLKISEISLMHAQLGWLSYKINDGLFIINDLEAGLTKELGAASIPIGDYSEIRFRIEEAIFENQGEVNVLKIPSGEQSGLKIKSNFTIGECDLTRIILDFELPPFSSNNNSYRFQPVFTMRDKNVFEMECVVSDCKESAFIQNENVLAIVKKKLGKSESDPLDSIDFNQITSLDVSKLNLENLNGIECFSNLTHLNISYNRIESLEPLSDLHSLSVLYAKNNQIKDASALFYNSKLVDLRLGSNYLENVIGIERLKSLRVLDLSHNYLSSFPNMNGLNDLRELNISRNRLENINGIDKVQNINALNIEVNRILDLNLLDHVEKLEYLYASYNKVDNLDFLVYAEGLKVIRLRGSHIQKADFNIHFSKMMMVDLCFNDIDNIQGLNNLPHLGYLHLDNNNLSDITELQVLEKMSLLTITNNSILCPDAVLSDLSQNGVRIYSDCN